MSQLYLHTKDSMVLSQGLTAEFLPVNNERPVAQVSFLTELNIVYVNFSYF